MISVAERIVKRVKHKGKGFAFTAKDFLDLGKRAAVDKALSTLATQGVFRRVGRGLYDVPRPSALLGGPADPDVDQLAQAIARNTGARIQPTGAAAANILGLSEQVPAKVVYLTDGLSRTVAVGNRTITFKRTRPRDLLVDPMSATVVQALLFLGREAVTAEVLAKLRRALTPAERSRLLMEARYSADWIAEAALRINEEGGDG